MDDTLVALKKLCYGFMMDKKGRRCELEGQASEVTHPDFEFHSIELNISPEGVVAQWCNPLTLQLEQSGGVGSIPGKATLLERHDKGVQTPLALSYFCDPNAWREQRQLHLHLQLPEEDCISHLATHPEVLFPYMFLTSIFLISGSQEELI